MVKFISLKEFTGMLRSGMSIMFGGFLACGTPNKIIEAIAKSGVKDLIIIGNDTAFIDRGIGILITNKQVKKVIVSHIGTNQNTIDQMNNGEIEVELCPQGTLIERIRSAGAGLGGVLTPTGLGTIVANGKKIINVDGKDYLLEKPLRADMAIVFASKGDKNGNLFYRGTTQNFNPVIATAADVVIAEVEQLVEPGDLSPEIIKTQGILIDYIINE